MTPLEAIRHSIAPQLQALNDRISEQLSSDNVMMNQLVASQLRTRGKQIRPIVLMLCAQMFAPVNDKVLAAAASVELLHNASLIHDDVVDDSPMRRNQPTINFVWDNHIAVLVGDFFTSTAMQQAIMTGDIRIINQLCDLGKRLSLGEIDQIHNARYHNLTEDSYFKVIEYKTASLFVACARMGCYAVDADEESVERLAEFAKLLGLCFQIKDDIFDYYVVEDTVGKPTHNDLREGKITLPLLYALLREDLPDSKKMLELIQTEEELSDDDIEMLLAFARNNGGIEYSFNRMQQLRDKGEELLSMLQNREGAKALLDLLDYIIARDH
jgi:octaprenyl-diphosphate synthase